MDEMFAVLADGVAGGHDPPAGQSSAPLKK